MSQDKLVEALRNFIEFSEAVDECGHNDDVEIPVWPSDLKMQDGSIFSYKNYPKLTVGMLRAALSASKTKAYVEPTQRQATQAVEDLELLEEIGWFPEHDEAGLAARFERIRKAITAHAEAKPEPSAEVLEAVKICDAFVKWWTISPIDDPRLFKDPYRNKIGRMQISEISGYIQTLINAAMKGGG